MKSCKIFMPICLCAIAATTTTQKPTSSSTTDGRALTSKFSILMWKFAFQRKMETKFCVEFLMKIQ